MLNTKKRAFGFGALIQTTRNYFKYSNNFVLTKGLVHVGLNNGGTIEDVSGNLTWAFKFFKVWREYTGREVLSNHWCFNPYECGCAGDETVSETRIVKKEEISEKEYNAIQEKDEETGMIR